MSQYDPTFNLKINVGHCDLYFMVQWFCLISWRLLDVWTSYFGIMSQYDTTFDLKINVGYWPIFPGPVILPYILKTVWYMTTKLLDYESVWPQNICGTLWPMFHGPVILPYILKTIWYMNTILGIICQYDQMFDLKIFVGSCDLYVMVQWFCLISWKLFSGWTSYFGIMSQYDLTSDLKIFVTHCDLYFMVHWICLISWGLFDVWTSYFGIMSQYDTTFDVKINVGYCDLYFMVQWFWHILNSIWWMNVILLEMSQCNMTFDLKINLVHIDLISWSNNLSSFIFCSEKHFSFIGKADSGELLQLLFQNVISFSYQN